jgi:predicted transcriptional regulator
MSTPRTISFRIDADKVAELDKIAKAMDRDRSYLLNEAVEGYLSEQRRFAAMVEEGLAASQRGELIDDEEVGRMIESWNRDEIGMIEVEQERAGATA